jgi:hypothetical protein
MFAVVRFDGSRDTSLTIQCTEKRFLERNMPGWQRGVNRATGAMQIEVNGRDISVALRDVFQILFEVLMTLKVGQQIDE